MDQLQEPLATARAPARRAGRTSSDGLHGAVELQHAIRVVHLPCGVELGEVPLDLRPARGLAAVPASAGMAGSPGKLGVELVEQARRPRPSRRPDGLVDLGQSRRPIGVGRRRRRDRRRAGVPAPRPGGRGPRSARTASAERSPRPIARPARVRSATAAAARRPAIAATRPATAKASTIARASRTPTRARRRSTGRSAIRSTAWADAQRSPRIEPAGAEEGPKHGPLAAFRRESDRRRRGGAWDIGMSDSSRVGRPVRSLGNYSRLGRRRASASGRFVRRPSEDHAIGRRAMPRRVGPRQARSRRAEASSPPACPRGEGCACQPATAPAAGPDGRPSDGSLSRRTAWRSGWSRPALPRSAIRRGGSA